MIILFQAPAGWGTPNLSPFCVKLELWLRMMDIPYRVEKGDPRRAPVGKVPWIEDDGKPLHDSTLIIEHLERETGRSLDGWLDVGQRARGHALQRMFEEATYSVIGYSRWAEDAVFPEYIQVLFADMPALVRRFVPKMIRKRILASMHSGGLMRHDRAQIYRFAEQDLDCFAQQLGDRDYLFGDRPSSYDAVAFGFIGSFSLVPFDNPARRRVMETDNLRCYVERIRDRYFPELAEVANPAVQTAAQPVAPAS